MIRFQEKPGYTLQNSEALLNWQKKLGKVLLIVYSGTFLQFQNKNILILFLHTYHLGTYFKLTIMRQHISVEPLRFLLTYYLNTYFIFLYYQYTFKERILRFQSIYRIKLKMYLLSVFENDTKQRKGARKGYTDFECFL